jgi:type I restriction enzyme S subunit
MNAIQQLLTDHIDIWTAAETEKKSGRGRASGNAGSVYGIKKLRELILELAVRGKLVPQDLNDEPASELLKRIQAEKAKLITDGKIKKDKPLAAITENEKPFDLPNGWEWVRVGQIGHDWGQKPPDSDFTYIEVSAINSTQGVVSSPELVRPENAPSRARKVVKKGTVIYSTIRPYLLNVAVIEDDFLPEPIASTAFAIVHPFCFMPPRYFLCYFRSPVFVRYVESVQMGIAYPAINDGQFFSGLIPLPPLAEQRRIVAKVDELMALCDQLETRHSNAAEAHETLVSHLLGTLTQSQSAEDFSTNWQRVAAHFDTLFTTDASIEVLKQTLLQLAVMGKLVPQNPEDEPASEFVKRIIRERDRQIEHEGSRTIANDNIQDSEIYISVPDRWQYCRLGNLARFIDYRGKTPNKVSSGIPLITAKNVRFGYISRDPEEYVTAAEYESWMTRGFPRLGDMLFTTEAPLGNVAVIDIEENFALAQRVICFKLHDQAVGSFLKIVLMSDQVQKQLINSATGMTAAGIKASKLKEIPVPLPPLAEQHRIVAKVDELMALCDRLKSRITDARQLQQTLADVLVEQAVA